MRDMKKSIKLYNFIDNDGEVLMVAATMEEIKKFFLERYEPEPWEDQLTEEMIKKIMKSDKLFFEVLEDSWRADVELIRTITSDDLK